MYKIRIRGIYATALTLLFVEAGYNVTKASDTVRDRVPLESNDKPVDVDITDRWNYQGINIFGNQEGYDRVLNILEESFPYLVTRRSILGQGSIYKARVVKTNPHKRYSLLDLGPTVGILPHEILPVNSQHLVKVKEPDFGNHRAKVTTRINYAGAYAVLLEGDAVKISRRITDPEKRAKLFKLGVDIRPSNYTLLWRTAADDQPDDALISDVQELADKAETIRKNASSSEAPSLIQEGQNAADAEFPLPTKQKLDKLRNQATPTIKDHHQLKAAGSAYSLSVDIAEKFATKTTLKKITNTFHSLYRTHLPTVGDTIEINHVKLDGRVVNLSPGTITEISDDQQTATVQRPIRGRGLYDGLGAQRSMGDYALSEVTIGSWTMTTKYFDHQNQPKGVYVNINTPIEAYPWGYYYVDLGVDVVQQTNGSVLIIDLEELDTAFENGYLTAKLKQKALQVANEEKERLKQSNE